MTSPFPITVYSTAVLYRHKTAPGRMSLHARAIIVSGINPLTVSEVQKRARDVIEGEWDLSDGRCALSEYGEPSIAYVWALAGNMPEQELNELAAGAEWKKSDLG